MSDRRLTPATDRVVLAGWDAPGRATVSGEARQVTAPLADLCADPDGARDRQLLRGAAVTAVEDRGGWTHVRADADGYCGWVRAGALAAGLPAPSHRVAARATHVYPEPSMKVRETAALSLGARVAVTGTQGRFAALAGGGFVFAGHLADAPDPDPVAAAERLLGTPYLWGGNSAFGIDCSGLAQLALAACAIACPGDSDLQRGAFPAVDIPERGDLLFWPGHVALAVSGSRMIHATAWAMAVIHEEIGPACARIAAAGDGPLLGIHRPR